MQLRPTPVWPWAAGFGALLVVSLGILVFAPPDFSFEVETRGDDALTLLLVLMAAGAVGLAGCVLVWQIRLGLRARREGRSALRALGVVVAVFLIPWLVGFLAVDGRAAAAVLLALGVTNVVTVAALCWVLARRAG